MMAPLDCSGQALLANDHKRITYRFFANAEKPMPVDLLFEKTSFKLVVPDAAPRPSWAKLPYNRCSNCTLSDDCEYCPAALGIAMFLPLFESRVSHEKTVVEVETAQRTIVAKTTFQSGMASLIGLVCATSGCPLTQFLRPMARFHMPFAEEQETLYRSFASWLLMSHVQQTLSGQGGAVSLDGLKTKYQHLSVMNASLAERLRAGVKRDAALNAVIILDLFAQIAPDNIDGGFEDIMEAFAIEGGTLVN
ncbi:hypothetical protein CU669_15985 [Paramagnetospirillum kuznetsovii]|uniref:Uncharacterized protein n=1 Tax=Paramagnetospirillum kuznetsovii TaxID=2053833 RepID=A0A364NVJ3_9PROT|nr:hypothetical protein [Paramagnetospirillum kuznetsovii]RAU20927.1 hypothetical protein CU669_15985 [Paramagnetospirillum kuznetsovii]